MVSTSTRAFGSPMRYIQGPGEYNNIETYTSAYGEKAFFLIDGFLFEGINKRLAEIYSNTGSEYVAEKFAGECCKTEVDRVTEIIKKSNACVVVAMGGGKTMDTGKIAANDMGLPLIIAPTSASTDAPTSAMSVLYTDTGEYIGSVRHKRNADMVLIDTEVISKAPLRLFVSGMGDAMATYFEARANEKSDSANYIGKGYRRCKAAMAIAKLAYDILLEDGIKAIRALKCGACTEAVENVIEANTLLSGLGFENAGCSAAHGIHAGLTELPGTHKYLHGEKVAFGVLCQMIMENTEEEEVEKIVDFFIKIGLPVTLEQLGVEATRENISVIANKVALHNPLIKAEPFLITEQFVHDAIVAANETGKHYLELAGKA
ncbi:MAG TPA: glycerol dehydrogenase [Bacillota bacterium]|nr:glycerol dehydrogenase [Bacillota bacterium]